jgi:hypothetical protein
MAYQPPENLAQLYRDILEHDARGQVLMEDLYQRFAAHGKVHTDGGIDAVLKTYRASAHREVIEYITRQINRGNGVNESQPEEDPQQ